MLLALACTPRPPTRHPRRIRWNASVLNENTPHYDLELLGSEGSHGRGARLYETSDRGRNSTSAPSRSGRGESNVQRSLGVPVTGGPQRSITSLG